MISLAKSSFLALTLNKENQPGITTSNASPSSPTPPFLAFDHCGPFRGFGGLYQFTTNYNNCVSFPALPYGDDNNDIYSNDDYEDVASTSNDMTEGEQVIHRLPTFTSVGETMLVNEGSTIRLPCIVNRLGKKFS